MEKSKKSQVKIKPVEALSRPRWTIAPLAALIVACGLAVGSCKTIYVPVPGQTVVEYRDSVVTKLDTLKIEIKNTEYIRDWTGLLDTLALSAEGGKVKSRAWVDTTKSILAGELMTEPRQVDVVVPHQLEYHQKDSTTVKPVVIEVPVEVVKKVYPRWMIILSILGITLSCYFLFRVYLKFKDKFPL
jgi:hypothetical protein